MFFEEIRPDLEDMLNAISQRSTYYGNKIPESVMRQFEIEVTNQNAGVLVPFWIPVLQKGRGVRKSNKDHGLVHIIFRWMRKRNMFRSTTPKGQFNEARFMTWYINKYGTKHFRSGVFVDIYETERAKTIAKIDAKASYFIDRITMQIL